MLGPIRRAFGELSAAAAADLYARSRYSRHDEAAGGLPNGPLFRRILGRAHSATPPGVLVSSQNRQRRGVESRFPPFLVARPGSTSRHLYGPMRRQHLRRARGDWKSARGPASSIDVSPIGCRRDEPCPIQRIANLKTTLLGRGIAAPANVVCQIRRGSCSLSRGDTSAEPITFYLNMPPMTEAKKITAATRSNPATIFLFRVTLRS